MKRTSVSSIRFSTTIGVSCVRAYAHTPHRNSNPPLELKASGQCVCSSVAVPHITPRVRNEIRGGASASIGTRQPWLEKLPHMFPCIFIVDLTGKGSSSRESVAPPMRATGCDTGLKVHDTRVGEGLAPPPSSAPSWPCCTLSVTGRRCAFPPGSRPRVSPSSAAAQQAIAASIHH